MLATALGILTVGYALYPLVHEAWQAFLVAAITGIGVGGFWPSQSTLIAGLTARDQRAPAFAMQRMVMNVGIGLGALTAGSSRARSRLAPSPSSSCSTRSPSSCTRR